MRQHPPLGTGSVVAGGGWWPDQNLMAWAALSTNAAPGQAVVLSCS